MKRPIFTLLATLLVACEPGDGARSVRGATTTAIVPAPGRAVADSATPAAPAPGQPICLATGAWSICQVTYRLERAGLAPIRDSVPVREEPLQATGARIVIGRGELEIYIYGSASERERDLARLDRSKYVVYPAPMPFNPVPTLITSANLIAILHSRNDHLRERVSDAITAGPPQPSPIRP